MYGTGPALKRGRDHPVDIQVRLCHRRRTNTDRLICKPDMRRLGISLRIDCDGPVSLRYRRAQYPGCDLAAVRYQDAVKHNRASFEHVAAVYRPELPDIG